MGLIDGFRGIFVNSPLEILGFFLISIVMFAPFFVIIGLGAGWVAFWTFFISNKLLIFYVAVFLMLFSKIRSFKPLMYLFLVGFIILWIYSKLLM